MLSRVSREGLTTKTGLLDWASFALPFYQDSSFFFGLEGKHFVVSDRIVGLNRVVVGRICLTRSTFSSVTCLVKKMTGGAIGSPSSRPTGSSSNSFHRLSITLSASDLFTFFL